MLRWLISVLSGISGEKNNSDTINEYKIMFKIRNGNPLDKEELLFINNLSREKLLEIIDINNTIISQLNRIVN